jgi:hypothetical protein
MIKSEISEKSKDIKEKPFPKLMIGVNTGTIYLALADTPNSFNCSNYYTIKTIVLVPTKTSDLFVGDINVYPSDMLEDFEGEIKMRNV